MGETIEKRFPAGYDEIYKRGDETSGLTCQAVCILQGVGQTTQSLIQFFAGGGLHELLPGTSFPKGRWESSAQRPPFSSTYSISISQAQKKCTRERPIKILAEEGRSRLGIDSKY